MARKAKSVRLEEEIGMGASSGSSEHINEPLGCTEVEVSWLAE
jgi:hypothetical protein